MEKVPNTSVLDQLKQSQSMRGWEIGSRFYLLHRRMGSTDTETLQQIRTHLISPEFQLGT